MAYGTIKVDTITFTDAGVDKSVTISGLVQNPTFSGNITVTGTVSGNTIQGQTVSGATITGGAAAFTTVTGGVATITSGVFALGSASNPSISFNGDANSGLYSPGADQVAISTGGSGRLFVDASGNINIGTGNAVIWALNPATNYIKLYNTGTNGVDFSSSTSFTFLGGGSERLRITSSGLVGIGTSSPTQLLTVIGSSFVGSSFNGQAIGDGSAERIRIGYKDGNPDTGLVPAQILTDATTLSIAARDVANSAIRFHTGSGTTERARIDFSGNVGIGTSSPSTNLHIGSGSGTGLGVLLSRGVTTNFFEAHDGTKTFIGGTDNTNAFVKVGSLSNHPVAIVQGNASAIYIDTSQRVGIGVTSPARTLDVNGSIQLPSNNALYISGSNNYLYADSSATELTSATLIKFVTNSTERLRITSAGLVGVGTSSPTENLTIYGNSSRFSVTGLTGSSAILLGNQNSVGANNPSVIEAANGALYFGGGNSWSGGGTFDYTMTLTDDNKVGIGTTSPAVNAHIFGSQAALRIESSNTDARLQLTSSSGTWVVGNSVGGTGNYLSFYDVTASSERARIDSSGRLLVGTSSARSGFFNGAPISPSLQVEGTGFNGSAIALVDNENGTTGGGVIIGRSRGTTLGSFTILQNNDSIGSVGWHGADGSDFVEAARIEAVIDGTPGANDMPGCLVFSTTADGQASPTPRMTITSDGYLRLASGTGGIQFNGDTAAANALDDYEEGTFTPTVVGGTTAGTATYSAQVGNYTKIGRQVNFTIYIVWSGGTGTGDLRISGLPFTVANLNSWSASFGIADNVATAANTVITGYAVQNGGYIAAMNKVVGGGANSPTAYDAAGTLLISGSYAA